MTPFPLQLKPDDARSQYDLGTALLLSDRPDEAIIALQEATRLTPDDIRAHVALALALRGKGRLDEAIGEHKKAVNLAPGDAFSHLHFGETLFMNSRLDEAIKEFREAARLEPGSADAHVWLGRCLTMRNLDGAIATYRTAIRLKPEMEAGIQFELGMILSNEDRVDEAIAALRRAVELNPGHADGHLLLGSCFARKRLLSDAVSEYRKATEVEPDSVEAHWELGYALQRVEDWDGALTSYRNARTLAAADPQLASRLDLELQRMQRLAALAPRLSAVIQGTDRPASAAEAVDCGDLARLRSLHAAAARFYSDAFTANPKLADELDSGRRYNAACAAALAGCGQGKDDPPLAEAGRAKLRGQALAWLGADLVLRSKQLESVTAEARADVVRALRHWKSDPDLAGVRDPEALIKLSDDEQKAWRALWAEAQSLFNRARNTAP
jgi:tetratricopeptide (TPR) repeat protein